MRSLQVVVPDELGEDRSEMLLIEDDQMVQTCSTERPDESLDDGIRPRARYGCRNSIDTDPSGSLAKVAAVPRVVIMEQMAWPLAPGRRLDHLLPHPGRGRVAVTLTCTSSRRW